MSFDLQLYIWALIFSENCAVSCLSHRLCWPFLVSISCLSLKYVLPFPHTSTIHFLPLHSFSSVSHGAHGGERDRVCAVSCAGRGSAVMCILCINELPYKYYVAQTILVCFVFMYYIPLFCKYYKTNLPLPFPAQYFACMTINER